MNGYGRLVSAATTGAATWTMLYNGLDDRVEVSAGSNVRRFVYDERGRLIGEYGTGAADVAAEHVWLDPDEGYEPLALIGQTTISWVHGDHLGTPTLLTDASGNIANSYQSWPFGQRTQPLAAPTTAMSFPGQVIDTLDRHYNRARDYDPTLGRYLQADPIGWEGDENIFVYVGGNPLGAFDPDGLIANWIIGAGAGALIGGGVDIGSQLWRNGGNLNCVDWSSVGFSMLEGALIGAFLGEAGSAGRLFGRARYRNGQAGFFNRGQVRVGWSWNSGGRLGPRNYFGLHGGRPGTPTHWHKTPIPGPKGPTW